MKPKCSQLTPEILSPRSQISRHSCNQCNVPVPLQRSYLKDLKTEAHSRNFAVLKWQFLLGFIYITRKLASLNLMLISINYSAASIHPVSCPWECRSSRTTEPFPYLACDHQILQTALKSQLLSRQICSSAMRNQTGRAETHEASIPFHYLHSYGLEGNFPHFSMHPSLNF